ncbi:hypothetical protein EV1_034270 [Malus domestica]
MVRITSKTEEKKPSFYKIVFYCYNTEELRIPPNVGKHMLEELTDRASLKLEDSSDYSWTVKVHSATTGGVYFKDGCPEFLKDNSLVNGEILVKTFRVLRGVDSKSLQTRKKIAETTHLRIQKLVVKVTLQNAEGKTRTVKVIPCNESHSFTAGWCKFVYANKIKTSDTCTFDLVSRNYTHTHTQKIKK